MKHDICVSGKSGSVCKLCGLKNSELYNTEECVGKEKIIDKVKEAINNVEGLKGVNREGVNIIIVENVNYYSIAQEEICTCKKEEEIDDINTDEIDKAIESIVKEKPVKKVTSTERMIKLRKEGTKVSEIADILNTEGYKTFTGKMFTTNNLNQILLRLRKEGSL